MGSSIEHKLYNLGHVPLFEKLENKYLEQFKGLHIDTKKGIVEMIGTYSISGETVVINVTDGFVSDEEKEINKEMKSEGYYFVGFTDEEGNIPQYIRVVIDCSKENIIPHPRSPETGKIKMLFAKIPGMQNKEQLNTKKQKTKSRVKVLCNSGITYGNFPIRKPIKQYRMLRNYY